MIGPLPGYQHFYHVTLTLEFDLLVLFENINLVNEC